MPEDSQPVNTEVAFLGVAERSSVVRDDVLESLKWNIMGLKHFFAFNFFPASLSGAHVVLAFRHFRETKLQLSIRSEDGEEVGGLMFDATAMPIPPQPPLTATRQHLLAYHPPEGWAVFAVPLPPIPPITLLRPGRYFVTRSMPDGSRETVGEFWAALVEPAPLTAERIAAIKSDPRAMKFIRVKIECNKCHEECRAYAGLERNDQLERDKYVWYADLMEQFRCHCGETIVDIASLKRNLFAPLGGSHLLQQTPPIMFRCMRRHH